jgi:hypothetical protein
MRLTLTIRTQCERDECSFMFVANLSTAGGLRICAHVRARCHAYEHHTGASMRGTAHAFVCANERDNRHAFKSSREAPGVKLWAEAHSTLLATHSCWPLASWHYPEHCTTRTRTRASIWPAAGVALWPSARIAILLHAAHCPWD